MGNTLGGKKTAKVMKINGETMKLKTPVRAGEIVKDYPGYVLLESEAVKHFGIRAMPLELQQELEPKRLYFLVELPKVVEEKGARRVRSGINMSAKDRLESLKLARRSSSDLSILRPTSIVLEESKYQRSETETEMVRVKVRVPKVEVDKLMMESKDEAEAAERIMNFFLANKAANGGGGIPEGRHEDSLLDKEVHRKSSFGRARDGYKGREKRVGFMPINEGEIQLAVAS